MTHYNETTILIPLRRGDEEAFAWVYWRFYDHLERFAESIVGSKTEAEDIAALAFHKFLGYKDRIDSYEHIRRLLFVIVRNRCINYLKIKQKEQLAFANIASFFHGATEEIIFKQDWAQDPFFQRVLKLMRRLPVQHRVVLHLYFFEGKSTAEIAVFMSLNAQTVLNHKSKALDRLRSAAGIRKSQRYCQ